MSGARCPICEGELGEDELVELVVDALQRFPPETELVDHLLAATKRTLVKMSERIYRLSEMLEKVEGGKKIDREVVAIVERVMAFRTYFILAKVVLRFVGRFLEAVETIRDAVEELRKIEERMRRDRDFPSAM